MRKIFELGGVVAALVLVAFGAVTIFMGLNGRQTVRDSLKAEQIVGGDDMSPALIRVAATEAGLSLDGVAVPTLDIVGQPIDTGDKAHAFAGYIRIHALESSGGLPYSQLPRFATADGKGTSDTTLALQKDGAPVSNPVRNTWVTATALSTALNTAYMAEKTALFSLVVGIALLLAGIGFGVLALGGALSTRELAPRQKPAKSVRAALPTA